MKIPVEQFAPISQLANLVSAPDPVQQLPQFDNQLEAVPGSAEALQELADHARSSADDLQAQANEVAWNGDAGNGFRAQVDEGVSTLRAAAGRIESAIAAVRDVWDGIEKVIRKVIHEFILLLPVVGTLIVLIITAAKLGALATIIAAIPFAVAVLIYLGYQILKHLDEVLEVAKQLVDAIKDLFDNCCPHEPECPVC